MKKILTLSLLTFLVFTAACGDDAMYAPEQFPAPSPTPTPPPIKSVLYLPDGQGVIETHHHNGEVEYQEIQADNSGL